MYKIELQLYFTIHYMTLFICKNTIKLFNKKILIE